MPVSVGSLEDGDIEEAINCAQKIGDDYLQTKARGYAVPESFNHGTSKQRMKWFKLGLETGDISKGNISAYKSFNDGTMTDSIPTDADIAASLAKLPKVE